MFKLSAYLNYDDLSLRLRLFTSIPFAETSQGLELTTQFRIDQSDAWSNVSKAANQVIRNDIDL